MMRAISRFSDQDLPISPDRVSSLRKYFEEWAEELS